MAAACTLGACGGGGKEGKAQSLAEKTLKAAMNDPGSLEIVEWGSLDSVFTKVEDGVDYLHAKAGYDFYKTEYETSKMLGKWSDASQMSDSVLKYARAMVELDSLFVPEFTGYTMTLKSRGNNAMGAKVLSTTTFSFDKELKSCAILSDE